MAVRIQQTGEVLSAYLSGELDHHAAKEMREQIDSALDLNMPTLLIIDFTDGGFMDSSGLGLILGRLALAEKMQCRLRLCDLSPRIERILLMAGIERLSGITIDREKKENTCENRR